ncbi:hypothetical protein ACWAU3_21110 [Shewanella sp. JL219SE-S6]
MELPLSPITQAKLAQSFSPREGETRLGQKVRLLPGAASYMDALTQAKAAGARFAIIGIKEDLGPRANLGQGGANQAFAAMLPALLNLQSNRFLSGEECLLLGKSPRLPMLPMIVSNSDKRWSLWISRSSKP